MTIALFLPRVLLVTSQSLVPLSLARIQPYRVPLLPRAKMIRPFECSMMVSPGTMSRSLREWRIPISIPTLSNRCFSLPMDVPIPITFPLLIRGPTRATWFLRPEVVLEQGAITIPLLSPTRGSLSLSIAKLILTSRALTTE